MGRLLVAIRYASTGGRENFETLRSGEELKVADGSAQLIFSLSGT